MFFFSLLPLVSLRSPKRFGDFQQICRAYLCYCTMQGRSPKGAWTPHEMRLCTGVYGEPPFWILISSPSPLPPPHFEKSGYAPGDWWKWTLYRMIMMMIHVAPPPINRTTYVIWQSLKMDKIVIFDCNDYTWKLQKIDIFIERSKFMKRAVSIMYVEPFRACQKVYFNR